MKMYLAGLNAIQLYVYFIPFMVLFACLCLQSEKMKHCCSATLFSADFTQQKDLSLIFKLASSSLNLVIF